MAAKAALGSRVETAGGGVRRGAAWDHMLEVKSSKEKQKMLLGILRGS
jgi:hypothetical protein